jgi:hypothetical protein
MNSLEQFLTTRMFLTAKAWLSRITHELLSPHEIHLLYADRESLELIAPDYEIVICTIIEDRYAIAVRWYWLPDFKPPELTAYLCSTTMRDPLAAVRAQAIDLLNDSSLYPAEDKLLGFTETILDDADEDVQKVAVECLANSGNPVPLPLLHMKSLHNDPPGRSVYIAALRLKILVDPVATFTEISSASNAVNAEILRFLEEHITRIPSVTLSAAIESTDQGIRWLVACAQLERGKLATDHARLLLADNSFRVRQIALEALIQQGMLLSPDVISQYLKETPPAERRPATLAALASLAGREFIDPEKVIEALFETYPEDRLKQEIGWYNLYGVVAYRVLTRKYFTTN